MGYTNTSKATNDHCKGVTKRYTLTNGGKQMVNTIPEGDLYRLIACSKLPEAEKFESWVFDEVIPTIRKTGQYQIQKLTPEQEMAKGLLAAKKIIDEMNNKMEKQVKLITMQHQYIEELKPDAQYTQKVLKIDSLVTTEDIAMDYDMSTQAMNKKLHELGIIYKNQMNGKWYPYKKYRDKGYTKSYTAIIEPKPNGKQFKPFTKTYMKWTQSGRKFIYETLKSEGIIPVTEKTEENA